MYAYCNQNLTDLRIYGIKKDGDTIEVPYLLKTNTDQTKRTEISFDIINQSNNTKGYFYTFKLSKNSTINHLKLDFEQKNFDWLVTLEGSQNQSEWFTIVEDYRILSIKNSQTNYQFTNLKFPSSQFYYYRLLVKSKEKPKLNKVYFTEQVTTKGEYLYYQSNKISNAINKEHKQTIVDFKFNQPIRANQVEFFIQDDFDYYRNFNLKYLKDSIKTERGRKKIYSQLTDGVLSSLGEKAIKLEQTTFQQLQLRIDNGNNTPIKVDSISVKGPVYKLTARFLEDANYFLVYGKPFDYRPTYDVTQFQNDIPNNLSRLNLGVQQDIIKKESKASSPLFENEYWLYGLLLLIILVLGWFSIGMIKKSNFE